MLQPMWFAWSSLGVNVICILVILIILFKEYQSQKQLKQDQLLKNNYQKSMRFFSISTIIGCLLFQIFSLNSVFNCSRLQSMTELFWYQNRTLTTFYQISRLQYTFSVDQIHSQKYGYSKKTFILLYIMGIIYAIFIFIRQIAELSVSQQVEEPPFRCIVRNIQHIMDGLSYNIIVAFVSFYYLVWDGTVVILYIKKCYQFAKKNVGNIEESVSLRIKFILSKILFLTLLLEIWIIISHFSYQGFIANQIGIVVCHFLYTLDGFISAFLVWLMLSHNEEKYTQFVQILDQAKICCCFKWFINIGLDYGHKNAMQVRRVISTTSTNEKENDLTCTVQQSDETPQKIRNVEVSVVSEM